MEVAPGFVLYNLIHRVLWVWHIAAAFEGKTHTLESTSAAADMKEDRRQDTLQTLSWRRVNSLNIGRIGLSVTSQSSEEGQW